MADCVLVFVELNQDKAVLPVSLECVTAGKRLVEAFGGKLLGLIMGNAVEDAAREATRCALDCVCVVDHPLLAAYQPELYGSAFSQVCERVKPRAIIFGDTLTSIDLAPRIAFSLNTGLITDCVAIECEEGDVCFVKPVYSGNVMAAYTFEREPFVITLSSRAEEPAESSDVAGAEIIPIGVDLDLSDVKADIVERFVEEQEGPTLTDADVVVSGGRGVGGPAGFEQLRELAAALNAAVGASRPPCDLGWLPPRTQVGQTGEKVAPSLYIAIGISGATQHVAGMYRSKKIVAINRDPKANIFRIADYGVVGPFEEVLPPFKEAISEMLR